MGRTIFLVDGFNLYYGVRELALVTGRQTKWLDLWGLCESYLPLVANVTHTRAALKRVHYFSAFPSHRPLATQERHTLYMRCLRSSGVVVELARFKNKDLSCPHCQQTFSRHEEKETDVALAVQLFEFCVGDEADALVLMTGDTDLAPAVRTCRRLFPQKAIFFAFPYMRHNAELKALAPESFRLRPKPIFSYQFPDPYALSDGTLLAKPSTW